MKDIHIVHQIKSEVNFKNEYTIYSPAWSYSMDRIKSLINKLSDDYYKSFSENDIVKSVFGYAEYKFITIGSLFSIIQPIGCELTYKVNTNQLYK